MFGKTVLVTEGNHGIGKAIAVNLARQGAHVVICAPTQGVGQASVEDIRRVAGSSSVDLIVADLSLQSDTHRAASEFKSRFSRLDVLVNNASAFAPSRRLTVDGVEQTFASNHLSYFVLTRDLLEPLISSAPSHIINVASEAHRRASMRWQDLQFASGRYSGWCSYAQSRLANLLFTYELARRLRGKGVDVSAHDPGVITAGLGQAVGGPIAWLARLALPFFLSPDQAATAISRVVTSSGRGGESGHYYVRGNEVPSSPVSYCVASQRKLWALSEALTLAASSSAGAPSAQSLSEGDS
jgi:NAD(P)-dependent dehydrogenase (short-subunit alcohol dehydrogenase family)